ncbi:hypothetical protein Dimus_028633 [Dionaea muscipula]
MDLIKRQRWENLFKRKEFVHIDAVKEFYARMTLIHLKKNNVVKTSVKGVVIEFDHLMLASILGIPGNNRICEYIKDVWEESKYTKPLEIIRRFANDETLTAARRVKSSEMKPFQRFIHFLEFGVLLVDKKGEEPKRYDYFEESFLTMYKLTRENEVWWIGTGENRRRDDDNEAPAEEVHEEKEAQNAEFDRKVVIDEAADQGESRSGEKFYDAEDEIQEPTAVIEEVPAVATQASAQQKETTPSGVDPSGPSGHLPESVKNKLQAEFERARADRIQADLEKAQAENSRLLALLQQA